MSEIAIRIPRDLEEKLRGILENVIRETYGEAMLSSIKSYINVESKDYGLVELLLYNPAKLVEYLTKVFGGSDQTAYSFVKTVLEKLYQNIGEIPEISIDEALRSLREGNEEKLQSIILELAYKLRVKSKKPLF